MDESLPVLKRDEIAHLISLGHILVLHRRTVYRLNAWLRKHPGGHLALLHFVGRDASNEIEAYHSDATLSKRMKSFVVAQVHRDDFSESSGWKPLTPLVQLGEGGKWGTVEEYDAVNPRWKDDLQVYRNGLKTAAAISDGERPQSLNKALLDPAALEPPAPPAGVDPSKQYRISRAWEDLHVKIKQSGLYGARPLWHYRMELVRYFGLFAGFLWVFLHASATCEQAASHLYVKIGLVKAFY